MSKDFLGRVFGFGSPEPTDSSPSFRQRVETFWDWFIERDAELYRALQDGSLDPGELSAAIAELHGDFGWELCPSPEADREGLALSAEGNTTLRLLVNYAISKAPMSDRWTFFASKQASEEALTVRVGDEDFDFSDFAFGLDFDRESESLSVSVNHPKFASIPKSTRQHLTMISLDSALGENFVEAWVGEIENTPEQTQGQKYGYDQIRRQARAAIELHDLDPTLDPIDRWYSISNSEPGNGDQVPRADIIAGSTRHIDLLQSPFDPEVDELLDGWGARCVYLRFPVANLKSENPVEQRSVVEDALTKELAETELGSFIGGALGNQYAYIDFVLFDERAAISVLSSTLTAFPFVQQPTLHYFGEARKGEARAL